MIKSKHCTSYKFNVIRKLYGYGTIYLTVGMLSGFHCFHRQGNRFF